MAWRTGRFGRGYGGLSTVGYRLLRSDGTLGPRIAAGIVERMPGSGSYWAEVDESGSPAGILWDIAEGSDITADESFAPVVAGVVLDKAGYKLAADGIREIRIGQFSLATYIYVLGAFAAGDTKGGGTRMRSFMAMGQPGVRVIRATATGGNRTIILQLPPED